MSAEPFRRLCRFDVVAGIEIDGAFETLKLLRFGVVECEIGYQEAEAAASQVEVGKYLDTVGWLFPGVAVKYPC